ncbi:hypothetical protein ASD45_04685 [Pseudolabrys sp. Root1462]|uniref:hypothetical protein n=1 Tax=Pseudolabrys sp. Root1462 TaxID=1736466 RepID=UPI0007028426|nr:hypothetical protein [Pseudolabrys sp. Root1462]KQZ00229.1 hypothetical protein ASD45_04685 [Pseudolabrys sp. Root1462]
MELSQSKTADGDSPGAEPVPEYTYRPSLLGAPFTFRLTADGLAYQAGRRKGTVPYRDIRRVRLSFKPASMQSRRLVTEIWADGTPKLQVVSSTWKSMMEQVRQDRDYSAFLTELHRRIAAAGTGTRFERGSVPLLYWPGLVLFVAVGLSLAALVVRGLQSGTIAGAAFVAAFLALFLWQGGNFLRFNRPGVYQPDDLPRDLVP